MGRIAASVPLGFLAPTKVGERWRGEAETERETAPYESPLSGHFAATSPPLRGGEEPKT